MKLMITMTFRMTVSSLCFLMVLHLSGCGENTGANVTLQLPRFPEMYRAFLEEEDNQEKEFSVSKKVVTVSVNEMPLKEFLAHISSLVEISVICEDTLDEKLVSIDVVDTDVGEVLSGVARRFNADIIVQGDLYYIGNLKMDDRGYLVRKVKRLSKDSIREVVTAMLSEIGRVFVNDDGLIVVGDSLRVLKQVDSMLTSVERQPANSWILQMYLITTTDKATKNFGFETEAFLDISHIGELDTSAAFAQGVTKVIADSEFRAILNIARDSEKYRIDAEPMMLLVDGGRASIRDGEKIAVPMKTVSDMGTVSTTGYEFVDTGIITTVSLREMSKRTASCDVSVELTQVTGYVEEFPITAGQTFSTTVILESGGTYLIGSISKKSVTNEKSGALLNTYMKKGNNDVAMSIWVRCYKIQGDYTSIDRRNK